MVDQQTAGWTFLTNHARVLLSIARSPSARIRDIAAACRITERTAQNIVSDLEEVGYLHRQRNGRRNQYTLRLDQPLRHPAEAGLTVRGHAWRAAYSSAGQEPRGLPAGNRSRTVRWGWVGIKVASFGAWRVVTGRCPRGRGRRRTCRPSRG
ncbi:hypothetical protein QFZ43_000035 [Streptomyces afghaniensis]|nr:hypothetical protein [Streptomyces afghaniensis]